MKYDFFNRKFIEADLQSEKLAVSGSDADLTWRELKEKTEKLVSVFQELNIPQGHPVIIYGHKESTYPVAMLACIQCNIPYVPTDKIYPDTRIGKILSITGSQVIINCTGQAINIKAPLVIDDNFGFSATGKPEFGSSVYGSADDPVRYIMFTSGSTGEPKGVQITQSALNAFVRWLLTDYGFGPEDVFMNQAPFTFDISLYDLLGAFSSGASVVLNTSGQAKDQESFIGKMKEYRCTIWNSTPSFVYLYLRNPEFNDQHLPGLREFILIGEELPNRTAGILKKNFSSAKVLNSYGPTEATVATSLIEITDEIIKQYPSLPIGYAMPGSELIIVKTDPEAKEGELIIAGDHVSIGYLKNEPLNKEKFFDRNGRRAFRTGDLAYYESGMLFFAGRNDDQVKMNGFRIELSEISNVIIKNCAVIDAVTVPLKRNNEIKKIISFVKPKPGAALSKDQILVMLEANLPLYMIPGDIRFVDEFPYSASHKIDRKKLVEDYLSGQSGAL